MTIELSGLSSRKRAGKEGDEVRTLSISITGFERDEELENAYDIADMKIIGFFNKALYGQTELPAEEAPKEGKKKK